MKSIWQNRTVLPSFNKLEGDLKTDVLIIGGGMAGLLCAYRLTRAGINNLLVEADTICSGVTAGTTGKITSQHGLIYSRLVRQFGSEKARMYYDANQMAVEEFRRLCSNIDCSFENKASFVYTLDDPRKIEKEFKALDKIGCEAEPEDWPHLPFQVAASIRFDNQAQFDPLAFAARISDGLDIREHTRVLEINGHEVLTDSGTVTADRIICTSHFPFINSHGLFFIKMYQYRSYVIALEDADDVKGMYIDGSGKGLSLRNSGNLLLIGGGGHRTGKGGGGFDFIEEAAARFYPSSAQVCRWAAQDCITLDGVPYIGTYSAKLPHMLVASGFNKWGMTSSMVSAFILTDMISGKENPYAPVFSPSRSILRPQLVSNGIAAAAGLLSPSEKRCTHMGCGLKKNHTEHSWDCPCHGSRFSEDGRIINGPAVKSLDKDKEK